MSRKVKAPSNTPSLNITERKRMEEALRAQDYEF